MLDMSSPIVKTNGSCVNAILFGIAYMVCHCVFKHMCACAFVQTKMDSPCLYICNALTPFESEGAYHLWRAHIHMPKRKLLGGVITN